MHSMLIGFFIPNMLSPSFQLNFHIWKVKRKKKGNYFFKEWTVNIDKFKFETQVFQVNLYPKCIKGTTFNLLFFNFGKVHFKSMCGTTSFSFSTWKTFYPSCRCSSNFDNKRSNQVSHWSSEMKASLDP